MRLLGAVIFLASVTAHADCRKPVKFVTSGKNWRLVNVLYKPYAEHTGKPVVVTLPRGDVRSVTFFTSKLKKERNVPYFSTGDVGDAFREPKYTPEALRKIYRTLVIRIKSKSGSCKWLKVNPMRRSDGK